MHIPFNFLWITINIYIDHKSKISSKNSMHKLKNYLRISTAQTELKSDWKRGPKTLLFCCTNNIGTKHGIVKIRSVVQKL